MAELPKFIALKSVKNQKYVVYKDQSTEELQDILQCSGEDVQSKYARFKQSGEGRQPPQSGAYKIHLQRQILEHDKPRQFVDCGQG
ncbi:hypothetical protein ACE6H2_015678 [Prunus campanulata]